MKTLNDNLKQLQARVMPVAVEEIQERLLSQPTHAIEHGFDSCWLNSSIMVRLRTHFALEADWQAADSHDLHDICDAIFSDLGWVEGQEGQWHPGAKYELALGAAKAAYELAWGAAIQRIEEAIPDFDQRLDEHLNGDNLQRMSHGLPALERPQSQAEGVH